MEQSIQGLVIVRLALLKWPAKNVIMGGEENGLPKYGVVSTCTTPETTGSSHDLPMILRKVKVVEIIWLFAQLLLKATSLQVHLRSAVIVISGVPGNTMDTTLREPPPFDP